MEDFYRINCLENGIDKKIFCEVLEFEVLMYIDENCYIITKDDLKSLVNENKKIA